MNAVDTVLVMAHVYEGEGWYPYFFLTDRRHDAKLDKWLALDPMKVMEAKAQIDSCYTEVVQEHIKQSIPSAKYARLLNVSSFSDEESLDAFILRDLIGLLNAKFAPMKKEKK